MKSSELIIAIFLFFAAVIAVTVRLTVFFLRFNSETRYITSEMRRAYSDDEYRFWHREFRCHYLCLIPFVNDRNVLRLYKQLFHKPKYFKKKERSDGIYHVLAPSVIAIFLCTVCLCSASWAWFTASHTGSVTSIKAATYSVTVTASPSDTSTVTSAEGIYEATLQGGTEYTVNITASGTATGGYCRIEFCGLTYHTPQIKSGSSFSFGITAYEDGTVTVTPQWGTCATEENTIDQDVPLILGTAPENSGENEITDSPTASYKTPTVKSDTSENAIPPAVKSDALASPTETPSEEDVTPSQNTEKDDPTPETQAPAQSNSNDAPSDTGSIASIDTDSLADSTETSNDDSTPTSDPQTPDVVS